MLELRALADVPEQKAVDFLLRRGFADDVVRWKYFDPAFDPARSRALVAVDGEHIEGWLGLIPFQMEREGRREHAVWTCDWYLEDPKSSGALGIRLLKGALERHPLVAHIGGNDVTRSIYSRLATVYREAGAVIMRMDLRFGRLVERLRPRMPRLVALPLAAVANIPVRRRLSPTTSVATRVTEGVDASVATLEPHRSDGTWHPIYDASLLDWELGRCPGLRTLTCSARLGSNTSAAAGIAWTGRERNVEWRMKVFDGASEGAAGRAVIERLIFEVQQRKGIALSVLMSEDDRDLISLCTDIGFKKVELMPYYLFCHDPSAAAAFGRLSFLDVDLNYRFGAGPNLYSPGA